MGAGFSIKAKANAEADIYIYEDVGTGFFGGVSSKQFARDLQALGKVSTINVHLNSEGGDVFEGLAIYRLLADHEAKVISHIDGLAASIASVIAMAGNEIRISEAGFLMIHDAWGLTVGNADDMRSMANTLDAVTGSISDVYVKRTANPTAEVRKWMKDETWFDATEAVSEGFATTMVENLRVAAKLDPSKHKYRNMPLRLIDPSSSNLDGKFAENPQKTPAKSIESGFTRRPLYDAAAARLSAFRAQIQQRKLIELRAA